MSTKYKGRPPAVPASETPTEGPRTPPTNTEECLDRIKALGALIDAHVQFMCAVSGLAGTSSEAKRQAAFSFCERLRVLERSLGKIREDLYLG